MTVVVLGYSKLDYFGSVNDAASAARHPLDAEILKPRRWQK